MREAVVSLFVCRHNLSPSTLLKREACKIRASLGALHGLESAQL